MALTAADHQQLEELKTLLENSAPGDEALRHAMMFLHERREDYHWVGVYRLREDTLELGPYVGPATEHVRIPVGRGVCGTAVAEDRNQVVADVGERENSLSCNVDTRSEIVVLIRHPEDGTVLGQIDVDGTRPHAFDSEEPFLQEVAHLLAPHT